MEQFIKHAYRHVEARHFFNSIKKEDVLMLYTKLDCIYHLLQDLGVVDNYSGNEILKDFDVVDQYNGRIHINVEGKMGSIDINTIIGEIIYMHRPIEK